MCRAFHRFLDTSPWITSNPVWESEFQISRLFDKRVQDQLTDFTPSSSHILSHQTDIWERLNPDFEPTFWLPQNTALKQEEVILTIHKKHLIWWHFLFSFSSEWKNHINIHLYFDHHKMIAICEKLHKFNNCQKRNVLWQTETFWIFQWH
jgi:hypothetical protein